MTDDHIFMAFGAALATAGIWLAATAKSGRGRTWFKFLGAEISVEAAGGILVILLGIVTFATPIALAHFKPLAASNNPREDAALREQIKALSDTIDNVAIGTLRLRFPPNVATSESCQAMTIQSIQDKKWELRSVTAMGAIIFRIGKTKFAISCWKKTGIDLSSAAFGLTREESVNQSIADKEKVFVMLKETFSYDPLN